MWAGHHGSARRRPGPRTSGASRRELPRPRQARQTRPPRRHPPTPARTTTRCPARERRSPPFKAQFTTVRRPLVVNEARRPEALDAAGGPGDHHRVGAGVQTRWARSLPRVYRRRIKSVQATKKITKAMELIASSRIVKAQQRVEAATPYTRAPTARSPAAANGTGRRPTLTKPTSACRARAVRCHRPTAVSRCLLVGRDQGGERPPRCSAEGMTVVPHIVGRKGARLYTFRP